MKNNFMITIGVNDLEKSIEFYINCLNFSLVKRTSPAPDIEIAFLVFNEQIEIELVHRSGAASFNNRDSSVTISFKTVDIDREYERLSGKNIESLTPPVSIPSGIQFLRFTDPNGIHIAYIQE